MTPRISLFLAAVLLLLPAVSRGEAGSEQMTAPAPSAADPLAAPQATAKAGSTGGEATRVLRVGVSQRPPYSMTNDLGEWNGIAVDLWETIAKDLGLKFEFVECIQDQLHAKLGSGDIDAVLVTAQAANFLGIEEFTQPYLFSHGGVVISHLSLATTIDNIIRHLTESGMFMIVLSMFLTMFVISLILLHFEGRGEGGHFDGPSVNRFASALWYTAVTMTSVGYGDTSRLSAVGRMITFIWMMLGILFVALFTGSVVSAITTADLNASVVRLEDLSRYRCGVFAGAKMERVLLAKGIPVKKFPSLEEGFGALARGQINAFAGDALSETYILNHDYQGRFKLCVMPSVPLVYSISLRKGDPDFGRINEELTKIVIADDWRAKVERWSGPLSF